MSRRLRRHRYSFRKRLAIGILAGSAAGLAMGIGVHAFLDAVTTSSLGLTSGTVNAEGALSTPTVSGRDVTVSWPADTLTDGTATTYYVLRDGSSASGTCSGVLPSATLFCTDNGVPSGTHTYAVVPTYLMWTGPSSSVASPAVGSPTLGLSPASTATLPKDVSGTVTDFLDSETVTFRLDDPSTGTLLSTSPSTVTTGSSGGSANPTVTIPAGIAGGSHTVYAIGSLGDQASATFTVSVPATLSFSNGTFSTLPNPLTGGAITYFRAGESVSFHLDSATGAALTSSPSSVTIGSNGQTGSAFTVTIPANIADGTHTVYAVGGSGSQATYSIAVSVPSTFAVTASQNLASLPGTVSGGAVAYFGAGENLIIRLDSVTGTILSTTPSTVTTDANGQATGFSATIPANIADGTHTLVALGNTTGLSATSNAFTVSAPSTFSITTGQSLPASSLPAAVSGGAVAYFAGAENVAIHLDTVGGTVLATTPSPVTTGSNGQASGFSVTIPSGTLGGSHTLWAVGATSGRSAQSNGFTVAATATGLSPSSGPVGTAASIVAQGFAANHALTVTVGGTSASITGGATTNASGSSTVAFTIPAVPNGGAAVVVSDGATSATSAVNFAVMASASNLSPTSGPVGTTGATIQASGFQGSTSLSVTVGGHSAPITSGGTTGSGGSSLVTFTIPDAPNGPQPVVVSDGTNSATSPATFTIQSSISVSPSSGTAGTTGVTLTGTGFVATKTVSVTFGGTALTLSPATPTVSATGGWSATFTVPSSAAGAKTIVATDSGGASAQTTFTVTAPAFTLNSVAFSGSVNGTPQANDVMTLTFSAAVKSSTVPSTPTVTFSRSSNSTHTFVTITGIFDSPVDTGGGGYLSQSGNRTAGFTSTVTVTGTTISVKLGTASGDTIGSGSSGSNTVTITPATAITDMSGNAASGSLTTATSFAFF